MTPLRGLFLASMLAFVTACGSEPVPPSTSTVPVGDPARGPATGAPTVGNEVGRGPSSGPLTDAGVGDAGEDAAPKCSCGTCTILPYPGASLAITLPCGLGICSGNVNQMCTETCEVRVEKVASCEADGG